MTENERADDVVDRVVQATKVTDNTAQEVIEVTRDKVELALRRNLPRYVSTGQMVGSAGLLVAILAAILTADFNTFLGIPGDAWMALFVLSAVASGVLFVVDVVRWLRRPTIDDLVDSIERDSRSSPRRR